MNASPPLALRVAHAIPDDTRAFCALLDPDPQALHLWVFKSAGKAGAPIQRWLPLTDAVWQAVVGYNTPFIHPVSGERPALQVYMALNAPAPRHWPVKAGARGKEVGVFSTLPNLPDGTPRPSEWLGQPTPEHYALRRPEVIRCVQLDIDADTALYLKAVDAAGVPPTCVIETSPGKAQVIWRVQDTPVSTHGPIAIALNRHLQKRFGGDRQTVDLNRVFRVPGTVNTKPEYRKDGAPPPTARILNLAPGNVYTLDDLILRFHAQEDVARMITPAYTGPDFTDVPMPTWTPEQLEKRTRMWTAHAATLPPLRFDQGRSDIDMLNAAADAIAHGFTLEECFQPDVLGAWLTRDPTSPDNHSLTDRGAYFCKKYENAARYRFREQPKGWRLTYVDLETLKTQMGLTPKQAGRIFDKVNAASQLLENAEDIQHAAEDTRDADHSSRGLHAITSLHPGVVVGGDPEHPRNPAPPGPPAARLIANPAAIHAAAVARGASRDAALDAATNPTAEDVERARDHIPPPPPEPPAPTPPGGGPGAPPPPPAAILEDLHVRDDPHAIALATLAELTRAADGQHPAFCNTLGKVCHFNPRTVTWQEIRMGEAGGDTALRILVAERWSGAQVISKTGNPSTFTATGGRISDTVQEMRNRCQKLRPLRDTGVVLSGFSGPGLDGQTPGGETESIFIHDTDDGRLLLEPLTPQHRAGPRVMMVDAPQGQGLTLGGIQTRPPEAWLRYLDSCFVEDKESKIRSLQQWMGAAILGCGRRVSKALVLHGLPGTGKGVFINTLARVVFAGVEGALVSQRPAKLTDEFALSSVVGAHVLAIPDNAATDAAGFKNLKTLISDDVDMQVARKYEDFRTVKNMASVVFGTNELLRLNEGPQEGIWRRLEVVEWDRPALKDEEMDRTLVDRVFVPERASIIMWALRGALELQANGWALHSGAAAKKALATWKTRSDSFTEWLTYVGRNKYRPSDVPDISGVLDPETAAAYVRQHGCVPMDELVQDYGVWTVNVGYPRMGPDRIRKTLEGMGHVLINVHSGDDTRVFIKDLCKSGEARAGSPNNVKTQRGKTAERVKEAVTAGLVANAPAGVGFLKADLDSALSALDDPVLGEQWLTLQDAVKPWIKEHGLVAVSALGFGHTPAPVIAALEAAGIRVVWLPGQNRHVQNVVAYVVRKQ